MENQLSREVADYKAHAWAHNTKRAYLTHRRTYFKFYALLKRPPAPADERLMCLFAAWLARRLSYSSVKQYLHIVTLIHKERGLPSLCNNSFQLQPTLRGIRRKKGDIVCPKAPITPELLLLFKSKLDLNRQKQRAVWAAGLIMFVGLLRRSNVMPPSIRQFTPDKHLCMGDVRISHGGFQLSIKWSKTNQFRHRPVKIYLPRRKDHPLCPVRALYLAQKGCPRSDKSPAIGYYESGVFHPLTPPVFIEELRRALSDAPSPNDYAGHSFRRGGATWLHQCGVSADAIKLAGQWASDCYQRYLAPGETERERVASVLVNSLP